MIGVVDCNNFFVSCERVFRPDLWGKPVVVLSGNDGCVVARSQEVKDMGIPMGVPYFQIKDILAKQGVTVFSSHFALYRDFSRRVQSLLRDQFDIVEQYSIDEAFVILEPEQTSEDYLLRIKDELFRVVGIPVSIGAGLSKTQAKLAVQQAKRGGGVAVVSDVRQAPAMLAAAVGDIWGVGRKLSERYRGHGLRTVADVIDCDTDRTRALFGVHGLRLQQELRGMSVSPVATTTHEQSSYTSSRSFAKTVSALPVLEDAIAYHARKVAAELRADAMGAVALHVSIQPSRHGDFFLQGGSEVVTLLTPASDVFTIVGAAVAACKRLFQPSVPYKKAGVSAISIPFVPGQQTMLFAEQQPTNFAALSTVIDQVNHKQGRDLLQVGTRLQTTAWQSRHAICSPAYTTDWNSVPQVQAK